MKKKPEKTKMGIRSWMVRNKLGDGWMDEFDTNRKRWYRVDCVWICSGANTRSNGTATTRETVTTATEIQQKTIEGFCGFGCVVGVIL